MELHLPATLTHAQATAQLAQWSTQLGGLQGEPLTLDCGGLQHFDSAALALMLELGRRARAQGSRLQLRAVPPRLHDLAVVYGLETLWN
jgi:phospholipid transport system transporter-binding protein